MTRMFDGDELVVASHNEGKVREIRELLNDRIPAIYSAAELDLPEPEETGTTFVANAELKALAAARESGRIALADDSGIAVEALGGEPGIYTARWAGEPRNFFNAMSRVNDKLGDNPDRRAHFVCALSLAWPDGHVETVEGYVHGTLVWPVRGEKGFGFDPMFQPNGHDVTFAEMDPDDKHAISHRADAFRKIMEKCFP